MNVFRENSDALNSVLTVKINPNDYQNKVKAALEKYRKTTKIPHFVLEMCLFHLFKNNMENLF